MKTHFEIATEVVERWEEGPALLYTPKRKLIELIALAIHAERMQAQTVVELLDELVASLSEMTMYSMPITGTDYFTFKDQEGKVEGRVDLLAKHHERPFENGSARRLLEANARARSALEKLKGGPK